jgi:hypothetical protein
MTHFEERSAFLHHLCRLREAIDETQPLAEYATNPRARESLQALSHAARRVLEDVDRLKGGH